MSTPYLDFILSANGIEVERTRVDCRDPAAVERAFAQMLDSHHRTIETVERAGGVWLLEVIDPDGVMVPMRLGTDLSTMVAPVAATTETINRWLDETEPK